LNAERLHAIARALREDIEQTNAPDLLHQLAGALQQQVANPSDPNLQQQVSSLRQQLDEALAQAPSSSFSPAWQQALEELGIADLFGEGLRAAVQEVFERNQITPAAAAEELTKLSGRLAQINTDLEGLMSALETFNIGAEELAFGEYEVGVLIPRVAVSNKLKPFARELIDLDRILLPFEELTTGERPDYEIRSISSSAFQIFLSSPGATVACIALTVERVVALYKQLLDIRLAHRQLKDSGVPKDTLGGIEEHASGHMASGIDTIVEELLTEFGQHLDDGRRHELRKALKVSLNGIANRIDRGYYIEVRAGLLPPDEEGEDEDEGEGGPTSEDRQYVEAISARQEGLRFMRLSGSSILSLPEADQDQPEGQQKKPKPKT